MAREVRRVGDLTDHDMLVRLDENVKEVLRRMSDGDERLAKLEARVDALENFRWWILGAAAATGFVFSYIGGSLFQ